MHLMIEEARAIHYRAVTDTGFRAECGLADGNLDNPEQFDWSELLTASARTVPRPTRTGSGSSPRTPSPRAACGSSPSSPPARP